jgi:hypothetical protein
MLNEIVFRSVAAPLALLRPLVSRWESIPTCFDDEVVDGSATDIEHDIGPRL